MRRLIKYKTEDGNDVFIEVNENEGTIQEGMRDVSVFENKADEILSVAAKSFEKSLDSIYIIGEAIVDRLKKLEPQKVEVEFGVSFSANAGAIITSIGSEANFKITLSWENKQ